MTTAAGNGPDGGDYWKSVVGGFQRRMPGVATTPDTPLTPAPVPSGPLPGGPVPGGPLPGGFSDPSEAASRFPVLHANPAVTQVRDRWERLVTVSTMPHAPEEVWQALTAPAALQKWLAVCGGPLTQVGRDCVLDFEDGEFFLCHPRLVERPYRLEYWWRWMGIGQATLVSWRVERIPDGSRVTVTEEAANPPADWQTWNGGGWCGILDQLAGHLRTGSNTRWPWRRMGPYVQVELPVPFYVAWERLLSPIGLRSWLQMMRGDGLAPDKTVTLMMGDASGLVEMSVRNVVQPGEAPPSFLPSVDFALHRPVWGAHVMGRLWLEPCGWGRSLLQVFHFNWENVTPAVQLGDRKILTAYWAGAATRARALFAFPAAMGPHSW